MSQPQTNTDPSCVNRSIGIKIGVDGDARDDVLVKGRPSSFDTTCSFSSSEEASVQGDKDRAIVTVPSSRNQKNKEDVSSASPKEKESRQGSMMTCIRSILKELDDMIEKEGKKFRSKLTERDIRDVKRARTLFHLCSVLPPILYYWFSNVDRPKPKFPASISHTIRKGAPQQLQMTIWTCGWYLLSGVICRNGSSMLKKFTLQMYMTGVVTTTICALGQNVIKDAVHFAGAGVYMIQHVVFLKILKHNPRYQKCFYGSFGALLTSIVGLRRLERQHNIPSESTSHGSVSNRRKQVAKLPSSTKSTFFCWELLMMISENVLFASFVHGMPSGLTSARSLRKEDDKYDKDERIVY